MAHESRQHIHIEELSFGMNHKNTGHVCHIADYIDILMMIAGRNDFRPHLG